MLGNFFLHVRPLAFTIDVKNWTDAVRDSAVHTNSGTKVETPEEEEKEEGLPKGIFIFFNTKGENFH